MGCHTWYAIPTDKTDLYDVYMRQRDVVEIDKLFEEKVHKLIDEDTTCNSDDKDWIDIWDCEKIITPPDKYVSAELITLSNQVYDLKMEMYKDVQKYDTCDEWHDGFRAYWDVIEDDDGNDIELCSYDEVVEYINKYEDKLGFNLYKETPTTKEEVFEYVKSFFDKHPDGYIHFG